MEEEVTSEGIPSASIQVDRKLANQSIGNTSSVASGSDLTGIVMDDERIHPSKDASINAADVLCGRGKMSFNHSGNKRFRDIITSSLDEYMKLESRYEKSLLVHAIVEDIKSQGGRFLKREHAKGRWLELTPQQCKEKVGHAMRDAVNTHETRRQNQQVKPQTIKRSKETKGSEEQATRPSESMLLGDLSEFSTSSSYIQLEAPTPSEYLGKTAETFRRSSLASTFSMSSNASPGEIITRTDPIMGHPTTTATPHLSPFSPDTIAAASASQQWKQQPQPHDLNNEQNQSQSILPDSSSASTLFPENTSAQVSHVNSAISAAAAMSPSCPSNPAPFQRPYQLYIQQPLHAFDSSQHTRFLEIPQQHSSITNTSFLSSSSSSEVFNDYVQAQQQILFPERSEYRAAAAAASEHRNDDIDHHFLATIDDVLGPLPTDAQDPIEPFIQDDFLPQQPPADDGK